MSFFVQTEEEDEKEEMSGSFSRGDYKEELIDDCDANELFCQKCCDRFDPIVHTYIGREFGPTIFVYRIRVHETEKTYICPECYDDLQ